MTAKQPRPAEPTPEQGPPTLDHDQAQGYTGRVVDPTANEVYALPNPGTGPGGETAPANHRARVVYQLREQSLDVKDGA